MYQTTATYIYKANLLKRITATLLDYAFIFGLTFFYFFIFSAYITVDGAAAKIISGIPMVVAWFLYFVITESLFGGTPAHMALHLKVVSENRSEIKFTQALKRRLLDPIDILFYGVPAIVVILNSERHQRLGDIWAKTIVIDLKDADQLKKHHGYPTLVKPQLFFKRKKQVI